MTFKGTNRAICACFIIITLTVALLEKSKKWVHSKRSRIQQNQEFVTGHTDEQPDDKATLVDWFKKPDRPLTPDADGLRDNVLTTDLLKPGSVKLLMLKTLLPHLMSTCKSRTELEYHFEECFKATNERLDWHNPEGKQYLFDLRKPLPLIQDHQVRQVIPKDYFINNDLEYLKGERLSKKYSTSITKTKAATYEVKWIEDMVLMLYAVSLGSEENIKSLKSCHLRVECSIANVHKTRRHSETSGRPSTRSRKLLEEAKYHHA
ncbi:hypothetical protein Tco_1205403 [Tanacetum coccineum]